MPDLEEEIIQNIKTILTTRKWSVPMDRSLGVGEVTDAAMTEARGRISAEIIESIKRGESRAQIIGIEYEVGQDGEIKPVVRIGARVS